MNRAILLVTLVSFSCLGQNNDRYKEQIQVITDFTNAVIDGATNENLIEQYLVLFDSSDQILEYVNEQLASLREKLKSNAKGDLSFKPYDSLVNKNLLLSPETAANTFIIYNQKGEVFPVLLEDYKIKAFSTMNKGGKKVFLFL